MVKFKKNLGRWFLDPMISKENGMEIIRPYVLFLPGAKFVGINGVLMQYTLFRLLKKLIEERKIELILGYNMLPEGIAAVRLAKIFKLPVGFWAIGTDVNDMAIYNRINNYLSRKCIEDSQVVLTESKDLENKVRAICKKSVSVQTFYKGIDVSNFQNFPPKNILMEKLQLNQGKRYILFVGRLIYDKGIYELAESFNAITKCYHDIDLILIGEEIEKVKLIAKFRDYGILNRVIFKGIIPYKEVACYMKISDLLVLPTWAEGLPNVVMEAMAVGLPVVATIVGGIPEILENRVTGLSVPSKNVEKLTGAVIEMIDDKNLRESCRRNAKELIHNTFDVRKNVCELYELLQEVINNYHKNN